MNLQVEFDVNCVSLPPLPSFALPLISGFSFFIYFFISLNQSENVEAVNHFAACMKLVFPLLQVSPSLIKKSWIFGNRKSISFIFPHVERSFHRKNLAVFDYPALSRKNPRFKSPEKGFLLLGNCKSLLPFFILLDYFFFSSSPLKLEFFRYLAELIYYTRMTKDILDNCQSHVKRILMVVTPPPFIWHFT